MATQVKAKSCSNEAKILVQGGKLGSGGSSIVYRATEHDSNRAVALKKSRVSLRARRTLLQHEANILKLLSGHPNIVEVFGYGRVKHFEMLSVELLDRSIGDVTSEMGALPLATVLEITDQLFSALDHIHSHGIVHRDIKPSNVLTRVSGSWEVCLIDFGLAYPLPKPDCVIEHNEDEPTGICGTLPFASINAHRKIDLTCRDDLESLSYTLLFLLRGDLPWDRYAIHGTILGQQLQVHEQKKRYSGEQLASGLPAEFGGLVDYARSLSAWDVIDYAGWRDKFRSLRGIHVQNERVGVTVQRGIQRRLSQPPPAVPPFKIGQIILTQLLPAITVEGYSAQAGHTNSYIRNPELASDEWFAPPRPSLVTNLQWDKYAGTYKFVVVAIGRPREGVSTNNLLSVPLAGRNTEALDGTISVSPDWPLKDSYCYVFKRPMLFICVPTQEPIPVIWQVDDASVELLRSKFSAPSDSNDRQSPDPDARNDRRMFNSVTSFYAQVSSLKDEHFEDTAPAPAPAAGVNPSEAIDWYADRAWFDECVKAWKRRRLDNGIGWTSDGYAAVRRAERENRLSDSYFASDYSQWGGPNQERDASLTLPDGESSRDTGVTSLEGIDEIVAVEIPPSVSKLITPNLV